MIAAPGRLPPGERVATPVALQELYGALLELAGIEEVGSSSLLAIADGAPRTEPIAAAAWPVGAWAKNIGGRYATEWRLYREADEALVWSGLGDIELYRVDRDPKLLANLAAEMPERAAELLERAEAYFARDEHAQTEVLDISDELSEQLRALGYADVQ